MTNINIMEALIFTFDDALDEGNVQLLTIREFIRSFVRKSAFISVHCINHNGHNGHNGNRTLSHCTSSGADDAAVRRTYELKAYAACQGAENPRPRRQTR